MGNLTVHTDSKAREKIMEVPMMPAIVQFPTVVREALETFCFFVANEPERVHFAEYLTGLIIANKKNISAINFWDHAEQRHKIAHDYIIANYVYTSGKHCPLEFYRFIKQEDCQERDIEFIDHNQTECFHREGKQHLGMGNCQFRNGLGQTRHMYMVFLPYSVLMRQLRQGRAREWARERLTTIGQACMSVLRLTLSDTISWVIERIEDGGWNFERIKVQLAFP